MIEVDQEDLMTSRMIADEFDLGHSTVLNWISRHTSFPAPVLTVGSTRVFSRRAVQRWITSYMESKLTQGRRPPATPNGLCGNRLDHGPHLVEFAPVAGGGPFWCHADQTRRVPWALERRVSPGAPRVHETGTQR